MSLLGNLVWLIFGGFLAGLGYLIGGALLCLTIVGIPFGTQAIKLGLATMTPFGKEVVEYEHANSLTRLIFNVIWMLLPQEPECRESRAVATTIPPEL